MRISDWSSDVCSSDLIAVFQQDLHAGLTRAGYPAAADPDQVDKVKVIAILCIFGLLATMVYGPLAAMLVELFPARAGRRRSEEHTSELQSLLRMSYAVFCLKKKKLRPTFLTY